MRFMWHAVLALGLGQATQATAATVSFDFAALTSGQWSDSLMLTSGRLAMTVTGSAAPGAAALVQTRAGRGLGVKSAADCTVRFVCHGLEGQIDTVGPDDLVQFRFNLPVRILSLSFGFADLRDRFVLLAGGVPQLRAAAQPLVTVNSTVLTGFDLGASVADRTLCRMSRARNPRRICRTYSWDSAFTLTGMAVDVSPAAVPLPATALLLLGGAAMLGLAARTPRRRRSP